MIDSKDDFTGNILMQNNNLKMSKLVNYIIISFNPANY